MVSSTPRRTSTAGLFFAVYQSGIMTVLPPEPIEGEGNYAVLVPAVNTGGNEIDGIQSVTLRAPLETYTGLNLRSAGFSEGDLYFLSGSFIPFATTMAERQTSGDPRLSLQERYGTHAGFDAAVTAATVELIAEGLPLPQDAQAAITCAEQYRARITDTKSCSLAAWLAVGQFVMWNGSSSLFASAGSGDQHLLGQGRQRLPPPPAIVRT
jgi:hypothetical protein